MPIPFNIHGPQISSSDEAQKRRYRQHVGKSGKRWLVAIQPNEGDNVYVEGGPNSDGFGGRTLQFTLEDDSVVSLKGPWLSGPDGLFKDTGYDIRDKHLTRGVVSLDRVMNDFYKPYWYVGVLHYDSELVLGPMSRVRDIAKHWAHKLRRKVWYSVSSGGGSSASWADGPGPQFGPRPPSEMRP